VKPLDQAINIRWRAGGAPQTLARLQNAILYSGVIPDVSRLATFSSPLPRRKTLRPFHV